jgi:AcrR family transcriptional regulator
MSIINFNLLSQTVDMRIVKTKKSIFRALLVLLQNNPITEITITDVCRLAMINRKTFYSHYESPFDAFLDMEGMIIRGYISELKSRHVIFASSSAFNFM